MLLEINWLLTRWEKYQREEEPALGLRKRVRKVVSYREAYVAHPSEMANEFDMMQILGEILKATHCIFGNSSAEFIM